VLPVISELRRQTDIPISIDTTKADVAEAALQAGADIVNDVSALQGDRRMASVLRESRAGCILMHMRGDPATMQTLTDYGDLTAEVRESLRRSLAEAIVHSGLPETFFILDPGIGFAKKPLDNPSLIAAIPRFRSLGRPVLMGPSRKAFIGALTGREAPASRVWGTAGAVAACVVLGADVVRVHDVAEMRDVVAVAAAVRAAIPPGSA
jgi:dihydropteroate synthase